MKKPKTACLLKYDFIILAGSLYHGKVQGILKRYISRNMGTLMEKPVAFLWTVMKNQILKVIWTKHFQNNLLNHHLFSNFGYEINPDEGNFIDKIKAKKTLSSENIPVLDMDEIDKFASYINNLIDKELGMKWVD